ncbi:MAG: ATP-binding protein [bacterium]
MPEKSDTTHLHNILENINIPIIILGHDVHILYFTPSAKKIMHLRETDKGRSLLECDLPIQLPYLEQLLFDVIENGCIFIKEVHDENDRWYSAQISPYKTSDSVMNGVVIALFDIRKSKEARGWIEWLLSKSIIPQFQRKSGADREHFEGKLIEIHTSRLLVDALGREVLIDTLADSINLLETSAAIYELKGDYTLGFVASEWCKFLVSTSKKRDNRDRTFPCQKCWAIAVEKVVNEGRPVDFECLMGEMRIYAIPIKAHNDIIGCINFGYGDPPRKTSQLEEIAAQCHGSVAELRRHAENYESRPPFIIEIAKSRLQTIASLIGTTVERRQAEIRLQQHKENVEKIVKKKTRELLKAHKDLEDSKRLSEIGALAASIAHELRNPLGVIQVAAFNIKRKAQNPSLNRHFNNIEKKIGESNQIINNILNYSQIKVPLYQRVKISHVLDESIISTIKRLSHGQVSVKKKIKSINKKVIDADPVQLNAVFTNILTNAIQSIKGEEGEIVIEAEAEDNGDISICFMDNGEGIDKKDLERVFEPFFTKKSKGTGLGLTICRQLVNLHNGRIEIKSHNGRGTAVTVHLPATKKE